MLRLFGGCPDTSLSGPKRHRFQDSRHRQALKEPYESCTRICSFEHLVHQSRLRDLRPLFKPSYPGREVLTTFNCRGFKACKRILHRFEAFLGRPSFPVRDRLGRIQGLLRLEKRDYS